MDGERSFGARREQILEPHVGERAAHHHLVVAATRPVGIEVERGDIMVDQVLARGTRFANRSRGRDVIGRDAVAQHAEHARAANVTHGSRFRRHPVEVRRAADVRRRRLPREAIAFLHRQAAPTLVAVEHLRVALAEHAGLNRAGDDVGPVFLRDIWPSAKEVADVIARSIQSGMFRKSYAQVFDGDERWRGLPGPEGDRFAGEPTSTYIRRAPYFDGMPAEPGPVRDIRGARVLCVLGDSITTDHISPAGSIRKTSPAGQYLINHDVAPLDFNSYGARRGNHEVMVRGTFANVRLKNLLAPGTEGPFTVHLPDGEGMTIYDASLKYAAEGPPLIVV